MVCSLWPEYIILYVFYVSFAFMHIIKHLIKVCIHQLRFTEILFFITHIINNNIVYNKETKKLNNKEKTKTIAEYLFFGL